MPSSPRPSRRRTALATALLATLAAVTTSTVAASPASASAVVTPGDFTGFGFDQCTAPSQAAMDAWLTGSPYWAVGIYI
jgi:hypothetical protein